MPLTEKGEKIYAAMQKKYGAEGREIFYKSRNKGTISGVDMPKPNHKKNAKNKH